MDDKELKAVLEHFSKMMENIDRDEFLRLLVEEETITEKEKYLIRKEDYSPFASHLLRRLMNTSFADFLQFLKEINMKREVIAVLENSVEEEAESSDSRNNKDEEEEDEEEEDKEDEEGEDDEDEEGSSKESETGAAAESPSATAPHRLQDPESILSEDGAAEKIFETMHNTMLHDPECSSFPSVTYGLFTVNEEDEPTLLKNKEHKIHMEVKFIVELMKRILSGQIQGRELRIVLYSNWSPCPSCVACILDFLQWGKKRRLEIRLTIKVVALYLIKWQACKAPGCQHQNKIYNSDYHQRAIEELFQRGVPVEAFTEEDWNLIKGALGLAPTKYPYSDSRRETDCMMKESVLAIKESSELENVTAGIAAASVS